MTDAATPDRDQIIDVGCGWFSYDVWIRLIGLSPEGQAAARLHATRLKDLKCINLQLEFVDWPGAFRQLVFELESVHTASRWAAPDMWNAPAAWVPAMAAGDHVHAFANFTGLWDEFVGMYPAAVEGVTYELPSGSIWGIPYSASYRGLPIIRDSHLQDAGIESDLPETWQELNEFAARLTVKDGERFVRAGFNLRHDADSYEDWLLQAGGRSLNRARTAPLDDADAKVAALYQHVRHGQVDGTMPAEGLRSPGDGLHEFCSGAIAMQQLWPEDLVNCQMHAPEVFADSLVGRPLRGPEKQTMQSFVNCYMMMRWTKEVDAVWYAMHYLRSNVPNFDIHFAGQVPMPCREQMQSLPTYEHEPYKTLAELAKHGLATRLAPQQSEVDAAITRWVERAALGQISVTQAVEEMDRETMAILSSN